MLPMHLDMGNACSKSADVLPLLSEKKKMP